MIVVGSSWRVDRLSCRICRARKAVTVSKLLPLEMRRRESVQYPGRAGSGHGHVWWRYSYTYGDLFGARGVACDAYCYEDGSNAP